jgi:hypothetical protein
MAAGCPELRRSRKGGRSHGQLNRLEEMITKPDGIRAVRHRRGVAAAGDFGAPRVVGHGSTRPSGRESGQHQLEAVVETAVEVAVGDHVDRRGGQFGWCPLRYGLAEGEEDFPGPLRREGS